MHIRCKLANASDGPGSQEGPSLAFASFVFQRTSRVPASLHRGLYAVARIRELRDFGMAAARTRRGRLDSIARIIFNANLRYYVFLIPEPKICLDFSTRLPANWKNFTRSRKATSGCISADRPFGTLRISAT